MSLYINRPNETPNADCPLTSPEVTTRLVNFLTASDLAMLREVCMDLKFNHHIKFELKTQVEATRVLKIFKMAKYFSDVISDPVRDIQNKEILVLKDESGRYIIINVKFLTNNKLYENATGCNWNTTRGSDGKVVFDRPHLVYYCESDDCSRGGSLESQMRSQLCWNDSVLQKKILKCLLGGFTVVEESSEEKKSIVKMFRKTSIHEKLFAQLHEYNFLSYENPA